MSTVVNRMTLTPLFGVDLSRYDIAHFWHDPDLSAVLSVNTIYWKEIGGVFSQMSAAEKAITDADIASANLARDRRVAKNSINNVRVLRALAAVIVNEINVLRTQHGLPDRTLVQLVTAIKAQIDLD